MGFPMTPSVGIIIYQGWVSCQRLVWWWVGWWGMRWPSGAEAHVFLASIGTAEAVPFHKPLAASSQPVKLALPETILRPALIRVVGQFAGTFPQRLKPHCFCGIYGTAEAVPFQDKLKLCAFKTS
jgi:hypothetical protein